MEDGSSSRYEGTAVEVTNSLGRSEEWRGCYPRWKIGSGRTWFEPALIRFRVSMPIWM